MPVAPGTEWDHFLSAYEPALLMSSVEFQSSQNPPVPLEPSKPFDINLAPRVKALPPYLFARINALLYQKRKAGDDVIDLGMGNPSDPPQELVIEQLAKAARDPNNHGY